jgi:hypothetical protein
MHLFAHERPETSPNQKALLIDGSAIPHIVMRPRPNGQILLQVLLRNYDDNSHAYRQCMLPPGEIEWFFRHFYDSPENALKMYFHWEPKEPTAKPAPQAKTEAQQYVNELL